MRPWGRGSGRHEIAERHHRPAARQRGELRAERLGRNGQPVDVARQRGDAVIQQHRRRVRVRQRGGDRRVRLASADRDQHRIGRVVRLELAGVEIVASEPVEKRRRREHVAVRPHVDR